MKELNLEQELKKCSNCETEYKKGEHDTEMCQYLNR